MKKIMNMKESNMKVNLKMIIQMEKELCIGIMVIDMMEDEKII